MQKSGKLGKGPAVYGNLTIYGKLAVCRNPKVCEKADRVRKAASPWKGWLYEETDDV